MSKLYAFSDIHGNLNCFKSALQQAEIIDNDLNWIAESSTIISLGDVIDRFPDSKGCIDLILKLKKQAKKVGGKVIILMGNHERMLIDARTKLNWAACWVQNGGYQCIDSYLPILTDEEIDGASIQYFAHKIAKYHEEYFDNLEQYAIIDGNLFVHAGVDPRSGIESLGKQICNEGFSHLWIRKLFYEYPDESFVDRYAVKRIIYGHTPTFYQTGDKISKMTPIKKLGGKLLGIDIGSYYIENGGICVVELFENDFKIAGISYNK